MTDDSLQHHLARLEAGEPLDAVLADLPADEAALVRMAASLRVLPQPARAAQRITQQRAQLIQSIKPGGQTMKVTSRSIVWAGLGLALAGGLVVLFGLWLMLGLSWLRREPVARPANAPTILATSPQSAALTVAHGFVEIQTASGEWKPARSGDTVNVGERLRTGAFSSAVLAFYDGSWAALGAHTEMAVTALEASANTQRTVQLWQSSGESEHHVAKFSGADSLYEVSTPIGAGRAQGTAFRVSVTTSFARFSVSEGAVAVTQAGETVTVEAGHTTLLTDSEPPAQPVPQFSGEGEVQAIGDLWTIAGQTMRVDPGTDITGDPRVGDWAAFEGRILPGGVRVADRITLIHRAITDTFSFVGVVEVISTTEWIISGLAVSLTAETDVEAGLAVSDTVEVAGQIEPNGVFRALSIRRYEVVLGAPFEFVGAVEAIGPEVWQVGGISITINLSTTLPADVELGEAVQVTGIIMPDGVWLAERIEALAETGAFDFVGVLMSMEPWNVSGVPFETDADTLLDDDLRIGNRVRVQGRVLPDGAWLAERITQFDNGQRHAIQFTALVQAIDPWVVGGVTVTVDSKTKIEGEIEVGDWVTVKGHLAPDGSVTAKKITLVAKGQSDSEATSTPTATPTATLTLEMSPTPTATPGNGEGAQALVCHIPSGDASKAKTLSVGAEAVAAHLAHGDTLGPCPAGPAATPEKPKKP